MHVFFSTHLALNKKEPRSDPRRAFLFSPGPRPCPSHGGVLCFEAPGGGGFPGGAARPSLPAGPKPKLLPFVRWRKVGAEFRPTAFCTGQFGVSYLVGGELEVGARSEA